MVNPPHISYSDHLSTCIYAPSAHDSTIVPLSTVVSSHYVPTSSSTPVHNPPSTNVHPLLTRSKETQSTIQALTTISVYPGDLVHKESTSMYETLEFSQWTLDVQEKLSALFVNQT